MATRQLILALVVTTLCTTSSAGAERRPADALTGPPFVSARAWAIADGTSGQVLWSYRANRRRPCASTTKMMTGWIVATLATANGDVLDEWVTVSKRADKTGGSSAKVKAGERIRVHDLLYGLMLPSGNDAGVALAEHFNDRFAPSTVTPTAKFPASYRQFMAEMHRRAHTLGMADTTYHTPYGDGRGAPKTSTATDLLKLAAQALKNPIFASVVNTQSYSCELTTPTGKPRKASWHNTNRLLGITGYNGVKTGTNKSAGCCLVSSGYRENDHLLVVVLGSTSSAGRYVDTRNLFRWAWQQRQ